MNYRLRISDFRFLRLLISIKPNATNEKWIRIVKPLTLVISWSFFLGYLILFANSSCCGYSTRSLLPDYLHKIHIRLFENQTFKIGLDERATNSVIEAFRGGSNLRIVDQNNADLIIEGTVSGFTKDPYTYTSDQTVIEYRITVKFAVRCVDVVKNDIFWEGSVADWATFDTNEEGAIDEAMRKTADRLVNTILTNW